MILCKEKGSFSACCPPRGASAHRHAVCAGPVPPLPLAHRCLVLHRRPFAPLFPGPLARCPLEPAIRARPHPPATKCPRQAAGPQARRELPRSDIGPFLVTSEARARRDSRNSPPYLAAGGPWRSFPAPLCPPDPPLAPLVLQERARGVPLSLAAVLGAAAGASPPLRQVARRQHGGAGRGAAHSAGQLLSQPGGHALKLGA